MSFSTSSVILFSSISIFIFISFPPFDIQTLILIVLPTVRSVLPSIQSCCAERCFEFPAVHYVSTIRLFSFHLLHKQPVYRPALPVLYLFVSQSQTVDEPDV